jgi:hypothetical protein
MDSAVWVSAFAGTTVVDYARAPYPRSFSYAFKCV